ncbi:MAG: TSUP family transporter [Cyanobacteria bacterium P01_H01_bin.119]
MAKLCLKRSPTVCWDSQVDIKVAALICAGFVLGGLFGAKVAVQIPELWLKRMFSVSLVGVGLRMILSR